MYKHILVPTDLTDVSRQAAGKAKELADQFGATLSIVHVIEPIPAYGYLGVTEIASPHIEAVKEELTEFAKEFDISKGQQHVAVGAPKIKVLEEAKNLDVDLMVVASHGRHGILRLLGSTANSILHGAECDVLTIRAVE